MDKTFWIYEPSLLFNNITNYLPEKDMNTIEKYNTTTLLCIIIISVFLVGVCVTEEILVKRTLFKKKKKGTSLLVYVQNLTDLNTEDVLSKTRELNSFWLKYEDALCFFVNHKDMHEMGISLNVFIHEKDILIFTRISIEIEKFDFRHFNKKNVHNITK